MNFWFDIPLSRMNKLHLLLLLVIIPSLSAQQPLATVTTDFEKHLATISKAYSVSPFLDSDSLGNYLSEKKNIPVFGSDSPYEWRWLRDGIWTGAGIGVSGLGLAVIKNKKDLPQHEIYSFTDPLLLEKKIEKINFVDRWVAGKHSNKANEISDIPFAISFAIPFVFLFDDDINDHTGQYLGLYLESLATTAAIYTITAGFVDRSRPYVYDNSGDTPNDRRFKNNGQRSFYSGHVAASATATFFAAKAYSDFHPDAAGKVFIWTGAAVIPAAVGIWRLEAGQHFITDIVLGYVLGAGTGILVPELHKNKNKQLEIYPSSGTSFTGDSYRALAFRYSF